MKFSLSWLKKYLDFNEDLSALSEKLTMIGLEVEEIIDEAESLEMFEVGYIKEAKKHENSNKLSICKVEDGEGQIHQIVCGAKNARAGIKVVRAKIGAVVPSNQMVIKKAKLAGVESNGMLCSASEIGVGSDGEGIIEIDEKWPVGTKISQIFNKDDAVIDVNITPNRGDCLGVYGIARDLAASGFGKLKNLEIEENKVDFESNFQTKIEAEEECGLFLAREIRNVKNVESPDWLKEKLESIGQNSISALVDITNYVMFCLNRPMHAYDLDKISGDFSVRKAKKGEKFLSLKDIEYELDEDILIVSDQKEPVGIAGVIGSMNSSCDENTQNIILEAAYFDQIQVASSGRKLNILSEARYRFERGVDYKTCLSGIELATSLIKEICGGEISDIKTVKSSKFDENLRKIEFDVKKIDKIIGIQVQEESAIEILTNLGFLSEKKGDKYLVEIPSHRSDVEGERDLIEEVIRIYGYDKIESKNVELDFEKPDRFILDRVRDLLVSKDMIENINWSFCDSKLVDNFDEIKEELTILNPISENLDYMRPNLIIGLLNSYKKNYLRGNINGSYFEIGKIFLNSGLDGQKNMISGLRAGENKDQDHYNDKRNFDIFDVKKDLSDIVSLFGIQGKSLQIYDQDFPKYYHPHRSATLKLGKNIIGYFGEIHPKILKIFDIKNSINIFEIFVDNLPQKAFEKGKIVKKPYEANDFQPIYRDFAFLVDKNKKIGDLTKIIESVDKKLIQKVEIFDIYQGENISEDKKSVALRVMIQPLEKNMSGEEIDVISSKVIDGVKNKFGGELRA